ncbi:hypothetical protein Z951_07350 [Streptomyces sp. PRh5]|uniref:hypothetical protein n=1 Tax=Streptomyces sp. PRh5 TaxID=1158056 RepID=UPI00044F3AAB|nr:hypothetical protein [Streptomyces sp. PRh5]EXU68680.1 hypothetical protein Z951_07350 [Streptomyces sp. PRh5]
MKPQLVFVHGIGGPRDPNAELTAWKRALAEGFRAAGGSSDISALTMDWAADSQFAYYGDLFTDGQAQSGDGEELDEEEETLALGILADFLDQEAARPENKDNLSLARVRAQIRPDGETQGVGAAAGHLWAVCTAVARVPGITQIARWTSAREVLGAISQPARYLRRKDEDEDGHTLDRRIRDRVLACLDPNRPAVVIGHSLGSVVALEALGEHNGPVPLFITIGSPIATPAFVWPRLRPQPPTTPECVYRWLDFWDGDDVVVPRARLADAMLPNARGVRPTPGRFDSRLLWAHSATTYLARHEIAGPVREAVVTVRPAAS